jgi:serpin B
MTYEGAMGETAEEMQSVFYFPDEEIRRTNFARIYNQLNPANAPYQLSTANALWAQEDYPFLDEYLNVTETYYRGKVTNLDFITRTEESRQTINTWVEEQTNNKIKDLLPQGSITSYTRLVLTNAIYFKGNWVKQFDKSKTRDQDFTTGSGDKVKVPMMQETDSRFNYAEEEGLQILEMPYEGDNLSMMILLPEEMEPFEESLTPENLTLWKSSLINQSVNVYMPKFKFETEYMLNENLIEMGMPTAFTSSADFSGMTGSRDLFITAVVHKAYVDVNEEGTEAAAATGVVVGITSAGPMKPTFRADHPFIFIIQDNEGNILFLGRVTDPR